MSILLKSWDEIETPKTPQEVLDHIEKYDELFSKIEASEKGSPEHLKLLRKEKVLQRKGVKLRKALGFLASDPCSVIRTSCFRRCAGTIKKKQCSLC